MGGSSWLSSYIQNRSTTVSGRGRSSIQTPDKSCTGSELGTFDDPDGCFVCADAVDERLSTIANANAIPSKCLRISKLLPGLEIPFLSSVLRIIHCASSMASRPIQTRTAPSSDALPHPRPLRPDSRAAPFTSPAPPLPYRLFGSSLHPHRTLPAKSTWASIRRADARSKASCTPWGPRW